MPLFPAGQMVVTPNALNSLDPTAVHSALARHLSGDWGDVDAHDRKDNDRSLKEGFRLLSIYHDGDKKFWIITEGDRSVTTVLLPEDY